MSHFEVVSAGGEVVDTRPDVWEFDGRRRLRMVHRLQGPKSRRDRNARKRLEDAPKSYSWLDPCTVKTEEEMILQAYYEAEAKHWEERERQESLEPYYIAMLEQDARDAEDEREERLICNKVESYLRFLLPRATPLHVALMHRVLTRTRILTDRDFVLDNQFFLAFGLHADVIGGALGTRMNAFFDQIYVWSHRRDCEAPAGAFDSSLLMDRTDAVLLERAIAAAASLRADPRVLVAARFVVEHGLSCAQLSELDCSLPDEVDCGAVKFPGLDDRKVKTSLDLVSHAAALMRRNDSLHSYSRWDAYSSRLFQTRETFRQRELAASWFRKMFASLSRELHSLGVLMRRNSLSYSSLLGAHERRDAGTDVMDFTGWVDNVERPLILSDKVGRKSASRAPRMRMRSGSASRKAASKAAAWKVAGRPVRACLPALQY